MNTQQLIQEGTFPRSYRRCTRESSLNPAIAYVLNKLAGLNPKDRILDPCCGTGTILIERQILLPCYCLGIDIDPRALDCARKNIDASQVKIDLKHGDIQDQNFSQGFFTKIISNLPWGIHSGSKEKNKLLYRFLADKSINWLKSGGKAIFLTNSKSLLKNAFAHNPNWILLEDIPLEISGLNLSIFIYQKE